MNQKELLKKEKAPEGSSEAKIDLTELSEQEVKCITFVDQLVLKAKDGVL